MVESVSARETVTAGPRLRAVRWGLGALVAAAAISYYGAYGDPRHIASQERAVPFIIAVLAVVAVLVFGLLVPAGLRALEAGPTRWRGGSLAVGIVALLTLPVAFWSGLPLVLGTAAWLLGATGRRAGRGGLATATLVLGIVAVAGDLVLTILGNLSR